ncbi:hypothetical protein [Streptomyces griseoluteus]
MAVFKVTAYRGNRNWHLRQGDYSRTVRDGVDLPPAREQAEALARELAERSHRNKFGWSRIDIQPVNEEPQDG